MKCHTAAEVREAAMMPLTLPEELKQADRRQLDDAVLQLLGVNSVIRREQILDRLYLEVTTYFRNIRIVEVQKMEQRRHGGGRDTVSAPALAADAWAELSQELRKSIPEWLAAKVAHGRLVEAPEGEVRLPEAGNFFEATTVYFGKKPAISHVCESRSEAELLAAIASTGVHGSLILPSSEAECGNLLLALKKRLDEGNARIEELAAERAGTEKLREQIVALLSHWFTVGLMNPELIAKSSTAPGLQ
jgi:hypothetical protein